jgi:hypothetical protein
MDKCWLIVNTEDVSIYDKVGDIPSKRRPSKIYCDKDIAENELLRLKQNYEYGEFVLFEAVEIAVAQVTGTGLFEIQMI